MPYGSRTRLGLDIEAADHAINLSDQLRLFSAKLIDIDNTVGAGRGDVRAAGIKRKVFCGLGQVAKIEHLVCVDNIDHLYDELATEYEYFIA